MTAARYYGLTTYLPDAVDIANMDILYYRNKVGIEETKEMLLLCDLQDAVNQQGTVASDSLFRNAIKSNGAASSGSCQRENFPHHGNIAGAG